MSQHFEQGPIRIGLVITTLEPGGAELCLTNLALGIRQRGFEPAVHVLGKRPSASKDSLVGRLEAAGISCRFLGMRGIRHFPNAVARLRAALRQQQPEIVQSFLYHANVIASVAAHRLRIPTLTSIRVAEPKKARLLIERFATRRADRIVCVSQDVAQYMRSSGFDPSRLVVIPNSISTETMDAAQPVDLCEFNVPPNAQVILYAGRLDPQKGILWLVEQAPKLLEGCPTRHLLIVGDGPEREAIRHLIGKLGLQKRVHLAGWQPDVAGFMKAASLLTLPSRWEGMPNVLLQAMACGLPVVCSRTHGVTELLGDDVNSQVFESGNSVSLHNIMTYVLEHPNVANELGNRNRRRTIDVFSLQSMLDRYETTYRELLKR